VKECDANVSETDDLRLLNVDVRTSFVLSSSERIERQNDPDCSPGPRLFFAGCPQGNIVRLRHDVEDRIARRLLAIAAESPRGAILTSCLNAWEKLSIFCLRTSRSQPLRRVSSTDFPTS